MQGFYYSLVVFLVLCIHGIVNHQYFLLKDDRKDFKDYRIFLIAMTAYFVTDAAWGILSAIGNLEWLYFDTVLYYIAMAFSVVLCCRYTISFLSLHNMFRRALNIFGMLFALCEIVVLLINHDNHIFFWFDESGNYESFFFRDLTIILQLVLFATISVTSWVVALHTRGVRRGRLISIALCSVCMTSALFLQLFFPLLPLYSMGLVVTTMIAHIFIHNEERNTQMRHIEALNKSLTAQNDELSKAMSVIKGLTRDFYTIWVADKDTMKYEMLRTPRKDTVKEMRKLAEMPTCDEALQKYVELYVCDEDKARILSTVSTKVVTEVLKTSDFYTVNYLRRREDGGKVYNQIVFANADTDDGKHRFVFGFRDINDIVEQELELLKERKMREEISEAKLAAEAANEAKTRFLQNMSHEIRTPLNAMFGFAQLLGMPDGSCTEEEKAQYNRYIYNSYRMLEMLVGDIIDIADSEHGNYRIDITDVNVNAVCANALMSVEFRVPAGVRLYMTSEVSDDFVIKSDERRIQQVLINYLTNACKNTQKGEICLHVALAQHPERVVFAVTDTGRGVPPEKADVIFKRFTKLNQFVQGSGLGLSICQTVANKLDGEVYIDKSYTGGARFVFELKTAGTETLTQNEG